MEVPTGNFQDLPLWRSQVAELAAGLCAEYRTPLLIPMTLVNPHYIEEIFSALAKSNVAINHFFLNVPATELERRITSRVTNPDDPDANESAKEWCKAQIEPCLRGAQTLPDGTVFLDGLLPVDELADAVLSRVEEEILEPTIGG